MKYVKKIPYDHEKSVELYADGWKKLREPKSLKTALLFSLPFMILNGLFSLCFLIQLGSPIGDLMRDPSFTIRIDYTLILYLAAMFAFILVHELLHAVFIPNLFRSEKTFWGLTLFGGFVVTAEEISKPRFIWISFAPFLILSVLLPLALGALGILNCFLSFLFIVNAMGSAVDFLNAAMVIFQTPPQSRIVSNGFETYYKSTKEE